MGKRRHFLRVMSHKGARRLMSMALAAALVLSSVPTAALAEVMDATVPQEQVVPIEKSAPAEDDGTTAAEASAASEEEPPAAAPTEVASSQDGSQQATPKERGARDRTLATTITNADGTNSDEGAQVRIGTANEALGNALGTAQLKARRLAGADLSSVVDALGRDAEGMQVDAYDVQLLSGGQRLELQKTDEVTAWLPKRDGATMYHVKDGVATKLDVSVDGGNDLLRADVDDLGTLAVAYPSDKEVAPEAPAASEGQAASESAPLAGPAQSGPAGEMASTGVDRAPAASLAGGPSVLDGLPASIVDGHAVVPLNNEDTGIADLAPRMFNAAYKTSGGAMSGQPQDATTPVAYLVVVEPEAKPVDKPVAASGLVYNGTEQVGVPEGVGYDLASGKATSAGAHKSVATLREGYAWSDGSTAPVVLDWTIDKAPLTATYRGETIATGEKPSLLVDVTGFVNGETPETAAGYVAPKVLAQSLEEGTHDLKPSGGAADNYTFAYEGGTLTVRKAAGEWDLAPGTYTVTANLSMPGKFNPLIPGLTVYANSPNNPFGPTIDENKDVDVQAEIPRVPLSMNAKIVVSKDGTRTLVLPIRNPIFTTQEIGACDRLSDVRTERVRPTAGGGDWSGSYNKRKDRIHMMSAVLPAGQAKGTATFDFKGSVLYAVPLDTELRPEGDVSLRLTVDYDSMAKASDSTELPDFAKVENGGSTVDPRPNDNPHGENSGSGGTNAGGTDAGDPISSEDGHLAAGSYTVSANIWVNREEAGLPLSPHFTNSSFPPSSSVSKNATLTVGPDGHAYVTIPIIIQSRIMHVLSISGLDIVSSTYDGEGGLTSITVDLGILRDASTITKTATASIRLGSLANSIIGGPADRTWSVTFEVVFNGAPTQTGGTLPKAALDIINAQGADGKAADGKARADAAAADALAALDAQKGSSAGGSSRPTKGEGVLGVCQEAIRNNPALKMGLGLLALAAAAASAFVARRHRDASPDAPKED